MDKTGHLKPYLPMFGRSKHQLQMNSHEDSAGEFCYTGSVFFSEVVRIYQQGNKALIN